MVNLNHIETFLLVVETNSFQRAATARGISRGAASKHVQLLEEEFGVPLFIRSTREVAITEEGKFIYEECVRIRESVSEIEALLSGLKTEPSGVLSVVCGPVFANKYLIPHLADFIKKYPKITLKLDLKHLMPNMVEENVDVVIAVHGIAPPDAIQRTVLKTRRMLCATPAYLKKIGKPKNPKDLLKHVMLIHPVNPNESKILLNHKKEIQVEAALITNDQLAIRRCVLADIGIAYIQRHVVEKELQEGKLVEVLKDHMPKTDDIPINMYYLQRRHLHSKIRAFLDFIVNIQ